EGAECVQGTAAQQFCLRAQCAGRVGRVGVFQILDGIFIEHVVVRAEGDVRRPVAGVVQHRGVPAGGGVGKAVTAIVDVVAFCQQGPVPVFPLGGQCVVGIGFIVGFEGIGDVVEQGIAGEQCQLAVGVLVDMPAR